MHVGSLTLSRSHDKQAERKQVNFDNVVCLIWHIKTSVFQRLINIELMRYFAFFSPRTLWNLVCIFHARHV